MPKSPVIDPISPRLNLTRRQGQVLHWLAEGKTNQEIASVLGCSFHTAKNHLRRIFQRLNVRSRTAAAACAYRAHIAEAEALRGVSASAAPPES